MLNFVFRRTLLALMVSMTVLTFAFALIVESPVIMFLTLGTALARSRQAYQVLIRFTHIMAWGLTGFHLLLGLSPLYTWILAEVVGAPPAVIEPSRIAFLLMTPWTGAIAYRRMWQGIMIRYGRTSVLFVTTAIRLVTTAAVAPVSRATASSSTACTDSPSAWRCQPTNGPPSYSMSSRQRCTGLSRAGCRAAAGSRVAAPRRRPPAGRRAAPGGARARPRRR